MNIFEEIGRRVFASRERKVVYIEENIERWRLEGRLLHEIRKKLRLSREKMSQYIGCADSVLKRFEEGLYIKRRKVIFNSYVTALKYIVTRDMSAINGLRRQ